MGSGPRKTRKRRKTDDKDQGQEDLQGGPKRPRELYRIDRGTGLPRQNLEKIEMEDTTSTSPPDPGIPHSETNITTSTTEENCSLPVIVPENEEIDEEHLICEPDLPTGTTSSVHPGPRKDHQVKNGHGCTHLKKSRETSQCAFVRVRKGQASDCHKHVWIP